MIVESWTCEEEHKVLYLLCSTMWETIILREDLLEMMVTSSPLLLQMEHLDYQRVSMVGAMQLLLLSEEFNSYLSLVVIFTRTILNMDILKNIIIDGLPSSYLCYCVLKRGSIRSCEYFF